MSTKIGSHVKRGSVPQVSMVNWRDERITIDVKVDDTTFTMFIHPEQGQSVFDLMNAVESAFENIKYERVDEN